MHAYDIYTFTEKNILDMIDFYSGQSFVDIRNRAMIALMFDTGVRLSELMEMIESQIHEDSIMIYGKGAKERVVPVSPFLEKGAVSLERPALSFTSEVRSSKPYIFSPEPAGPCRPIMPARTGAMI